MINHDIQKAVECEIELKQRFFFYKSFRRISIIVTYMYFHRLGENNIILKCRLSIYVGASQNLSSTRYSCFTRKCPVTLMNDDGKKLSNLNLYSENIELK